MIDITFDLTAGTAKLATAASLKTGSQVPVRVTFTSAPGTASAFSLALGSDATPPVLLAYTDVWAQESPTVWTATLDATDSRLATYMNGKGATGVNAEFAATLDGIAQVAPNFQVTVQPKIVSGSPETEGGPMYYTEGEVDAFLAEKASSSDLAGLTARLNAAPADALYVFSHFVSSGSDERLYISTSLDGMHWLTLNGGAPVFTPTNFGGGHDGLRDPSLLYDVATSTFYVCYTAGDGGNSGYFKIIKSTDLLNWTPVTSIVSGTAGSRNYSPEWFVDTDGTVRIFWGFSVTSDLTTMVITETHQTTPGDFTAWSTPATVGMGGANRGEPFVFVSPDDGLYHMVCYKVGSPPMEHWTSSTSALTGWTLKNEIAGIGGEGAILLRVDVNRWRLYNEPGNGVTPAGYRYYDIDVDGSGNFNAVSPFTPHWVSSSVAIRNGTFIIAPTPLPGLRAGPAMGDVGLQNKDNVYFTGGKIGPVTLTGAAGSVGTLTVNLGASDGLILGDGASDRIGSSTAYIILDFGGTKQTQIGGFSSGRTERLVLFGTSYFSGVVKALGGVSFPTADPHLAGAWWDNAGVLTKSAG